MALLSFLNKACLLLLFFTPLLMLNLLTEPGILANKSDIPQTYELMFLSVELVAYHVFTVPFVSKRYFFRPLTTSFDKSIRGESFNLYFFRIASASVKLQNTKVKLCAQIYSKSATSACHALNANVTIQFFDQVFTNKKA